MSQAYNMVRDIYGPWGKKVGDGGKVKPEG
jgi:hypothetical protein